MHHKELAAVGVGAGVRHRQGAGQVVPGDRLVRKAVPRPAHAGALRVAALAHKPLDDAVEYHAVVEALPGQEHKVVHRIGRFRSEQLKDYCPVAGVHGGGDLCVGVDGHWRRCVVLLGHGYSLSQVIRLTRSHAEAGRAGVTKRVYQNIPRVASLFRRTGRRTAGPCCRGGSGRR